MSLLRCGGGGTLVGRFGTFDDLGDEAVAAFGEGLNEAWVTGIVAEELAELKHVGAQNLRLHVGLWPKRIEEFVVGNEAPGILDEVAQDCERLGRKSHWDAIVEQTLINRVEPKGPKLLHSDRTSG